MKNEPIPDNDNIARFCKPSTISEQGEIKAGAFMLRSTEEFLSVNWLEFLKCSNRENEIKEIQKIYNQKFKKVSANARIAILNVGKTREIVRNESSNNRNIEILHDPINDPIKGIIDESHCGIYNLKQDDEFIAELICETICEHHSARLK
jgi:hypothetical protein